MFLRNAFRLFVILDILLFTSFSPLASASIEVSSSDAPTASTRTVCDGYGVCDYESIQRAIDESNPGDIIDLASETYTETITINEDVTILGDGPEHTIIQAAGAPGIASKRVVDVVVTATVTIQGVTIRYGNIIHNGGGIRNRGTLTLTNSIVFSNTADIHGGGIYNLGSGSGEIASLRLIDSFIEENVSVGPGYGGGIYNEADYGNAFISIFNSTISDNNAFLGGGISNKAGSGTATINMDETKVRRNSAEIGGGILNFAEYGIAKITGGNSAVSGNSAGDFGAGICNLASYGPAEIILTSSTIDNNLSENEGGGIYNGADNEQAKTSLRNSTVSNNSAVSGGGVINYADYGTAILEITASTISTNTADSFGGIYNDLEPSHSGSSTITMTGSISADNSNGDCENNSADGAVFNNIGYNIIETASTSCGSSGDGDPGLGPLQDNGGPTFTHALLPGSQALDAIPSGSCLVNVDQRGWPRPIGSGCDIGAYEFGYLIFLPLIMR